MAAYAQNISLDANCGEDYRARNPVVLSAYDGFIAYQPLYQAGCTRDSQGSYCKLSRNIAVGNGQQLTLSRLRRRCHQRIVAK